MNVLEAEIASRLPRLAGAGGTSSGFDGMPALSRAHIDQWLIHGLSALMGEALGFRHAVVAEARSRGARGDLGHRREDAFWPGLVDLFPANPASDIGAWALAPIVWYESHIKPLVESQSKRSKQLAKQWKKWESIDQGNLLSFVQDALEQRLEWTDEPNGGIERRLVRFLRPMPLPGSEQSGSDPGEALVLEVSSKKNVNILPKYCGDGYFFVVGQLTRTHGLDSRLITDDGMQSLYSSIAGHVHPATIKCWDVKVSGLIAVAVGIEGALVVWSDVGVEAPPAVPNQSRLPQTRFGPAASLGLLWLIAIYQRETAERCARISVRLSRRLKGTSVSKELMNDARSLVRWTVQEELCWMYSEAGDSTQIDEAFQQFQKALDIERLWQDIREQSATLDNYLQTEHAGAQSRSLARLTMLAVPVPVVTALLTLNASDVQKWGEYIKVEQAAPWLERSAPNQTPPTTAAANTIGSAMNCTIEIVGSLPSNRRSATGHGTRTAPITTGTAHCMLDASASDPSLRMAESAQVTQRAQVDRKFWNTNPLGFILGSVLALSLTMLAFAMNRPLKRYALTISSVLVAAYFFAPGMAQTYSLLLGVAAAVAWMWYFAKEVKRGAAKWQPEYLGEGALWFIAGVFAVILLRGLWLIGRPI